MSNYTGAKITRYSAGTIVQFPNSTVTIPNNWEVIEYCSPFGFGDYQLEIFTGKGMFTVKYRISPADILQAGNNATDAIREQYWHYIFL